MLSQALLLVAAPVALSSPVYPLKAVQWFQTAPVTNDRLAPKIPLRFNPDDGSATDFEFN